MARVLQPIENRICERHITWILFQLIDEYARIQRDPVMVSEKSPKGC